MPAATDENEDSRRWALEDIDRMLADRPKLCRRAHKFVEPKILHTWRPDLVYVEYDYALQPEQLDAYLRGDDEQLDEIDDNFRDGDGYEDALNLYSEDLIGKRLAELDETTSDDVRQRIQGDDRSDVIEERARHNRNVLAQVPAVDDDDAFGEALNGASIEVDFVEKKRLLEKPFRDALTADGIELNKHNLDAIEELISEKSLDSEFRAAEQWQLKLVVKANRRELSLSSTPPQRHMWCRRVRLLYAVVPRRAETIRLLLATSCSGRNSAPVVLRPHRSGRRARLERVRGDSGCHRGYDDGGRRAAAAAAPCEGARPR